MYVWVISSPGDRIDLRMISSPSNRISLLFLYSKLVLFSTCWNISPCLYFLEVGIVQFISLSDLFSGLVDLHLSSILVLIRVTVISAWTIFLIRWLLVYLSESVFVAISITDSIYLTKYHVLQTIISL